MIDNPEIMRQLAEGRLEQRRREARDYRIARSARPAGEAGRRFPKLPTAAWFTRRRRRPSATPCPATT